MSPEERASVDALRVALGRWQTMPPINISLPRHDAYIVVGGLQLLTRHPDIEPLIKEVFERVGRALQTVVADDPDVYAMLELGWHPRFDVEQDPPSSPSPA